MKDIYIQELVDLGIAQNINGYEESLKYLALYEEKYNLPTNLFYKSYYDGSLDTSMNIEDISDWIFYCNCYLSCGGNLNHNHCRQDEDTQTYIVGKVTCNDDFDFNNMDNYKNREGHCFLSVLYFHWIQFCFYIPSTHINLFIINITT